MVCLGNICRSPIAEVVLVDRLAEAGLDDRVSVSSAGTGHWHIGKPMDRRAAATLTAAGYDATRHRAQQYDAATDEADLLFAMDASNHTDLASTGSTNGRADGSRLRMFREFDPVDPGSDVPDPYYGEDADFEEVLTMVERTVGVIVAELERHRPWGERAS